jgi:hypothetical protein
MHRRRCSVDPTQLACSFELFRTKLPANQYLGISDFLHESVKILQLNKFMLGKLTLETRPKPLRSVPEFEAMMDGKEDFHEGFADFRKCS